MKCQILFSGKIKKSNSNLSSSELAQSVVKENFVLSKIIADNIFFFFKSFFSDNNSLHSITHTQFSSGKKKKR